MFVAILVIIAILQLALAWVACQAIDGFFDDNDEAQQRAEQHARFRSGEAYGAWRQDTEKEAE